MLFGSCILLDAFAMFEVKEACAIYKKISLLSDLNGIM